MDFGFTVTLRRAFQNEVLHVVCCELALLRQKSQVKQSLPIARSAESQECYQTIEKGPIQPT